MESQAVGRNTKMVLQSHKTLVCSTGSPNPVMYIPHAVLSLCAVVSVERSSGILERTGESCLRCSFCGVNELPFS